MVDFVPLTSLLAGDNNSNYTANVVLLSGPNGRVDVNSNIYVDSSGNIGIGTTLPSSRIDINGAAIFRSTLSVTGQTTVSNLNVQNTSTMSSLVVSGNVSVSGNLTSPLPIVLSDVSGQTDGVKAVFALRTNQTPYTSIVDSKNLEVIVDGRRLKPYVKQICYPWFCNYYGSWPGYRVSGSNVIIYNAPDKGSSVSLTVVNNSTEPQTQRYPYLPTTIVLGD